MPTFRFQSVRAAAVIAAIVAAAEFTGCTMRPRPDSEGAEQRTARAWVVLIDRSRSTTADRAIYRDAVRHIVDEIVAGDRFVMAAITATSGDDFRVSIDHTVPDAPPPQGLFDEPKVYARTKAERERGIAETRRAIETDAAHFLDAEAGAGRSAIFDRCSWSRRRWRPSHGGASWPYSRTCWRIRRRRASNASRPRMLSRSAKSRDSSGCTRCQISRRLPSVSQVRCPRPPSGRRQSSAFGVPTSRPLEPRSLPAAMAEP